MSTENVDELRARLAAAEAQEAQKAAEAEQRRQDAENAHARSIIDRWPQLNEQLQEEALRIGREETEAARAFDLPLFLQKRLEWISIRYTKQAINNAFDNAVMRLDLDLAPKAEVRHIPMDGTVQEFLNIAFAAAGGIGNDRADELLGAPEQVD